jgi:hypothetical protein
MANKEFDIHGMFTSLCARDELLKIAKEAAADNDRLKKAVTTRAELLLSDAAKVNLGFLWNQMRSKHQGRIQDGHSDSFGGSLKRTVAKVGRWAE